MLLLNLFLGLPNHGLVDCPSSQSVSGARGAEHQATATGAGAGAEYREQPRYYLAHVYVLSGFPES